jgi:ribonuclease BN (tRNA processing enzyme)
LLQSGAGFRRLDRLLLTHGHFDHVLGIPGLFSTLRLQQSPDVMRIHGGPGTAAEAAALAAASNVKLLVLTHISGRYPQEDILAEATKTFPNCRVAADFDHIVV